MKKINIILTLFSLIALASCSGGENSSSSMSDQSNWSSEDLAVIESVIGEGNTLPFFPAFNELEYENAYVDYSCNYAIITSLNACKDEEQFNTYVDICLEQGFFKDDEANYDYRFYALMYKEIGTTANSETIQYILYYDDELFCYIETYVIEYYNCDAFPTNPTIESLINISWTTLPAISISEVTYDKYTANYHDKVEVVGKISDESVIQQYCETLTNNNYKLDFDRTSATKYCYYLINEYELDGDRYADAVEVYFSKTSNDGYIELTYVSILETPLD